MDGQVPPQSTSLQLFEAFFGPNGNVTTDSATLQIHWGGIKFVGGQFSILVDGTTTHICDFDEPFTCERTLNPGTHMIQIEIPVLGTGVRRNRLYTLSLSSGKHLAQLRYSRLWGNFEKQLQLQRL